MVSNGLTWCRARQRRRRSNSNTSSALSAPSSGVWTFTAISRLRSTSILTSATKTRRRSVKRQLDDTHRIYRRVGLDADLGAVRQEFDVDTPLGGHAVGDTLEVVLQVSQHRQLPWLFQ